MAIYPVILCGGSGTRLWPASRPSRPKQFIRLAGNRSLFQDTVIRVARLVENEGKLLVVAGQGHRDVIDAQLVEIDTSAQLLLEPEARDSAAAMAAAAAWVARNDPDGILAFVASDHYIPDDEGFRRSILDAVQGARAGRIVTLGIKPTEASSAYGYIKPTGPGLSAIETFCEKPDAETALGYMQAGYLWNSGNFIVSARTLGDELARYAPGVQAAAVAALPPESDSTTLTFGPAFTDAPKISIDYAVMEKTHLASVLEVSFAWSDLGAWDSIASSGVGNTGIHIFEDAERCLARAPDGVLVAALGVNDIAIIVESDAVLVCDLSKSQGVKRIVDRVRTTSPNHLDFVRTTPEPLEAGARRFAEWLRLRALPTWSSLGMNGNGGFAEALSQSGRPVAGPRRARVQTRQIYVYAQAGVLGWAGPSRQIVSAGLDHLFQAFMRADGQARTLLTADGHPLDETTMVYDQAFVLFAMAAARKAETGPSDLAHRAAMLRNALVARALPNGAIPEAGDQPFQSNAHMHLLEACLAWEAFDEDGQWSALSDRIADLATRIFIDREGGFLREFFAEDWTPAAGENGSLVEPGHQFEWAWLLTRYGLARGDDRALLAARTLYARGRVGVAGRPGVAVDAMNQDLTLRSARARLWPQTEWLKASLILAETARDGDRAGLLADAATALRALWLYLEPDGLWHDKRLPDGTFLDEPAPASSFYHIMAAFQQVSGTLQVLGLDGGDLIALD
ncbi:AGE family epimerase/isomerase [Brevundimonas subvibrioides]|uniref:AGE family epimerase/isomerase n=1 Tax=Brevundimonas subvibrioides TaxID=74313 RepID=UPI0022B3BFD1|nr:AGE family epimerase/isomerase [Brevundimonas subvibrioides]